MSAIDPRILSQIANLDAGVHEHREAIASGRRRENDLGQLETEIAAEVKEAQDKVEELKQAQKKIEQEMEDLNRQAKIHHGRLSEITDTREYRALNDEIRYLRRQIEQREETSLTNLEQIEKLEEAWKSVRDEFNQRRNRINAEREQITTERQAHQEGLAMAQAELDRLLDTLPESVVRFYRRRAARQDMPLVRMVKDACGACQTKLTPQARLEVLNAQRIVTCQTCGRIIVRSTEVEDSTVS